VSPLSNPITCDPLPAILLTSMQIWGHLIPWLSFDISLIVYNSLTFTLKSVATFDVPDLQ